MRALASFSFATISLLGCGANSNINQIWGKTDSTHDRLTLAELYYDRGDFASAIRITDELLAKDPNYEDAAVLRSYGYLSSAGMDPFRLACKLIKINSNNECPKHASSTQTGTSTSGSATSPKNLSDQRIIIPQTFSLLAAANSKTTTAKTNTTTTTTPVSKTTSTTVSDSSTGSTSTDSSSTTDIIKKLSLELLSVSEEEYQSLSEETKSNGLFEKTPILIPKSVDDALRSGVRILSHLNTALKGICRFVDPAVLAEFQNDEKTGRYDAGCSQSTGSRLNTGKSHMLWGFAHLAEAMVYQSVLLYANTTSSSSQNSTTSSSNFQSVIDQLSSKSYNDTSGLNALVSDVDEVRDAINRVFDTTDGSMLSETLKDIRTVNLSFSALGLPEEITQSIDRAINSLNETLAKFGDAGNSSSIKTQALKTQMTEAFTKKIGAKVDAVFDQKIDSSLQKNSALSDQQKEEFKKKFTASGVEGLNNDDKAAVFGDKAQEVEQSLKSSCNAYDDLAKDQPAESAKSNKPKVCN